jgi:hypothetical protein
MIKKILLSLILFSGATAVLAATFNDVPGNSNYYLAVEALKKIGIISGYSDGTYHPERIINRAEALKLILKSAGIMPPGGLYNTGLKDITLDSWYAGYVFQAQLVGIVKGYPDGTFRPDRQINLAEFIKMSLVAFKIDLSRHQNLKAAISNDSQPSDWFTPYLSYARTVALIYPDNKNNLYPQKNISRGECADILYKMLVLHQGGEPQKLLNMTEAKLIEALVQIDNKNIAGAIASSNQAVAYSRQALQSNPSSTAIQAANTMAKAFQKLFLAYQAAAANKTEETKTLVLDAKNLAAQAVQINPGAQSMADRIQTLANKI